jgi:hypothetical protein
VVEVRTKRLCGDEATCLADDGAERAGVQFSMGGDRLYLSSGWRFPNELDVAAVLRGGPESEAAEDADDLVAREPTKLRHTTAALRS